MTQTATLASARTFTGSTVTGICMIAAPVLAAVGAASAIGIYSANGSDFIRAIAAHPDGFAIAINIQVMSMMLLIFAVPGVAQAVAATRPRLGQTGGVLTTLGLCGPIFFEGIYWGGSQLTGMAGRASAAAMYDRSQVVPQVVMNISGPALVVGFIVLAVGAAKTGLLSRPRAVALGVTCLVPADFISGFIVISAIAFVGTAIALAPLGLSRLRRAGSPD